MSISFEHEERLERARKQLRKHRGLRDKANEEIEYWMREEQAALLAREMPDR